MEITVALGRSRDSSDLLFQTLGPWACPNQGRNGCHTGENLSSLRAPSPPPWILVPSLIRVGMAIEPGRSSGSHLTPLLAHPTPALCHTKMETDRAPQEKMQPVVTSDLPLAPKLLGTNKLHRDAPTQVSLDRKLIHLVSWR